MAAAAAAAGKGTSGTLPKLGERIGLHTEPKLIHERGLGKDFASALKLAKPKEWAFWCDEACGRARM